VVVRHCGFTAVVKASSEVNWEGDPISQDISIEEHPEGGANALNVNRSVHFKRFIAVQDMHLFMF
jgi:protein TIF31